MLVPESTVFAAGAVPLPPLMSKITVHGFLLVVLYKMAKVPVPLLINEVTFILWSNMCCVFVLKCCP